MINAIIITCFILGIIVFALIFFIVKKFTKKKCHGDCGKCVFLESVWKDGRFVGLRCRKGYW